MQATSQLLLRTWTTFLTRLSVHRFWIRTQPCRSSIEQKLSPAGALCLPTQIILSPVSDFVSGAFYDQRAHSRNLRPTELIAEYEDHTYQDILQTVVKMADLQGRKVFKVFNQDFIVDERYTVTKELGQGAYGIVW